jgi:hypothetical protein
MSKQARTTPRAERTLNVPLGVSGSHVLTPRRRAKGTTAKTPWVRSGTSGGLPNWGSRVRIPSAAVEKGEPPARALAMALLRGDAEPVTRLR